MGVSHTCVLMSDGSMWCWGNNINGQMGQGDDLNKQYLPVQVQPVYWGSALGQTSVTQITAGSLHTCAVLSDGPVWCWGLKNQGRLGYGSGTGTQPLPERVMGAVWGGAGSYVPVHSVSAGADHTCAVLSDGSLWCWGAGGSGRLGLGSNTQYNTPAKLQLNSNVPGCVVNDAHSTSARGLVLWGAAVFGPPPKCRTPGQPNWPAAEASPNNTNPSWSQLAGAHASLGDDLWLLDPALRHALPPWAALADATPGMHVALGSVRSCDVLGGGVIWQLHETLLVAPLGSLVHLNASAVPPAACSGWRVAAVFTNGSLDTMDAGVQTTAANSVLVVPMHAPLRVRVLAAVPGWGNGRGASRGGGHPAVHAAHIHRGQQQC